MAANKMQEERKIFLQKRSMIYGSQNNLPNDILLTVLIIQ